MTSIIDHVPPTEVALDDHPDLRPTPRRGIARLAVGAPLALALAVALHPNDTSDAADTLARIAGDERGRWLAAHIVEPLAWLAVALVLLLASQITAPRSGRLIRYGGWLAAAGAAACALIVYSHGEALLLATGDAMDRVAMEQLYSEYETAMPLVGPLAMLFRLGLVVLGTGLYRSRAVPRWAAVALIAAPFAMMPAAAVAPAVGAVLVGVPLVVGLAGSATAIASTRR